MLPRLPGYAELHCRSNYSFLTGASHPEELAARAQALGYAALAITDECSLAGVVRAHAEARRLGLHLIVGAEMHLQRALPTSVKQPPAKTASPPSPSIHTSRPPPPTPAPMPAERPGTAAAAPPLAPTSPLPPLQPLQPLQPVQPMPIPMPMPMPMPMPVPVPVPVPVPPVPRAAAPAGREAQAPAPAPCVPRLVLLAMSRRGYGNLSMWITVARRRATKGSYVALMSDVEGKVPNTPTLAGLPDCLALLVAAEALSAEQPFETLFSHALWLKTWFGDRAALALSLLHQPHDALLADITQRVATLTGLPIVATGSVLMHLRSRKPLQDVLTATRLALPVAECGFALQPNAEAHLRSRARLATLYRPEWLEATLALAGRCAFSLDELRYEYPEEIVPPGQTPTGWLRQLTEEGAARRFPAGVSPAVRATLEHELALIAQLQYEPYFLTVADLVQWARAQGILCQGRGSAANSAVCYCLGVTEVDPARMSLLFERFISAERNEPPDIDIDFEHQRREEVIQYVYRKYGRHRAALTGVVISYRPRSALRDVGRALGIDLQRIDAVSKSQHWWTDAPQMPSATQGLACPCPSAGATQCAGTGSRPASAPEGGGSGLGRPGARPGRAIDPERLRENGFDPDAPLSRLWAELTATLIGFPRHLSQHPGGFVIARDQLARLVPVENAAMEGRSVIQWDKDDLDVLGLLKVDLLALGMLSAIRRALDFVGAKLGRPGFQMQDVPAEDKASYEMLCKGDSVGTFQVESRAQMSMLPRLQPRCFYDLVIEVAIVRPGPIQGGMVHPYLRRRTGEEPVDYPSDEVRQALQRTLGVPIFQEQVMQLAILAADFTPGEADQLRRAMAAWKRKGGLGPFHERLVGRMVAKGYTQDYAERIFKQIQGFGEYGFPESHAASFALLVYVSAWLKCHHPDAFLAALLNSQPMGFYAPAQLVRDAREHGVEVRPVDVMCSEWDSILECHGEAGGEVAGEGVGEGEPDAPVSGRWRAVGPSLRPPPRSSVRPSVLPTVHPPWRPVRLGLSRLSGFSEAAAQRLLAARAQAPFASAEDLARRACLDAGELSLLARADALASITGDRHHAAWAVAGIDTRATALLQATRTFEAAAELPAPSAAEAVLADYRATGLSLTQHPVALLRERLAAFQVQPAAVLRGYPHGRLARASGIVTHRQRPETAKGVVFVTLEDETGAVNVIVWRSVAEAQRRPLLASTLLTVYGVWQRQGEKGREVRHLVAKTLVDHSALLQGLAPRSRNFR